MRKHVLSSCRTVLLVYDAFVDLALCAVQAWPATGSRPTCSLTVGRPISKKHCLVLVRGGPDDTSGGAMACANFFFFIPNQKQCFFISGKGIRKLPPDITPCFCQFCSKPFIFYSVLNKLFLHHSLLNNLLKTKKTIAPPPHVSSGRPLSLGSAKKRKPCVGKRVHAVLKGWA